MCVFAPSSAVFSFNTRLYSQFQLHASEPTGSTRSWKEHVRLFMTTLVCWFRHSAVSQSRYSPGLDFIFNPFNHSGNCMYHLLNCNELRFFRRPCKLCVLSDSGDKLRQFLRAGLRDRRIWIWFPAGTKIVLFCKVNTSALGPMQYPIQ